MKQLLAVCGVLALAACTKVEDERVAPAARKPVESLPSSRAVSGIERRVLDLAPCRLECYQITSTCPAMEALSAELRNPGSAHELSLALGSKLLMHTAPAVRLEAAALLGDDAASRDAVVDAARREPEINVREAMIRILAADGARHPRVGAFLLESAQHGSSEVRTQALAALTLPANRELPGAADRVLAMAERDPDPSLRQAACRAGGTLGSALWVPFYERVTATTDVPALYAACMEGVVSMFLEPPSNEAAYRLFLRRVTEAPSKAPWQVMSAFCYTHEWKQRPAWFDATEVKAAMTAVITDRAASWQARAAAIESMVGLGATRDELKALEAGSSPRDTSDKLVLAKLDSALAE
ncbi:hypothetical protein BH11MYX3_BH11MYX3_21620 [soil metagenome]